MLVMFLTGVVTVCGMCSKSTRGQRTSQMTRPALRISLPSWQRRRSAAGGEELVVNLPWEWATRHQEPQSGSGPPGSPCASLSCAMARHCLPKASYEMELPLRREILTSMARKANNQKSPCDFVVTATTIFTTICIYLYHS